MASPDSRGTPRYFGTLNYSLANEDTSFELALLKEPVDHVVAVAGSGARVLPLVGFARKRVTCMDVAAPQLFLTELRLAAVRALDLDAYRAFLGYPPRAASPEERRRTFDALALSAGARAYWGERFAKSGWEAPLYDGRWERTFQRLARVNRTLTGDAGARLFEARTLDEQRAYMASGFPRAAFRRVLRVVGNAAVFNALLYRGHFPKKNTPGSHFEFYEAVFERLLTRTLARESFFLQLVFFGEIRFAEGCPSEARSEVFARTKAALANVEIDYRMGDAITEASALATPADFVSLSDIASYFDDARAHGFLQELRPALAPNAVVASRTYLRVLKDVDLKGFARVSSPALDEAAAVENVGVYTFDTWRRAAS